MSCLGYYSHPQVFIMVSNWISSVIGPFLSKNVLAND